MFQKTTLFSLSSAVAKHAGHRQTIIAQNIANADTPGYKAKDIKPFNTTFLGTGPALEFRSTRAGHQAAHSSVSQSASRATTLEQDNSYIEPNGNTVSIENEMLNSVEIERTHKRALTIYQHGMTLVRSVIKS